MSLVDTCKTQPTSLTRANVEEEEEGLFVKGFFFFFLSIKRFYLVVQLSYMVYILAI